MLHTLIVSGHTDLHNSVANRRILDTLERELPGAEVLRLDALYTNKPIDVPTEQDRLRRADVIVFQFPLFWFNIPSLLQRWMEEVWLHGFSHGTNAHALKGKKLLLSLTTGAPAEVYTPQGADAPDFRVDALFGWTQSDFGANTFYSTKSANQWEGTHRLLAGVRAETKGRLHLAPQVSWLRNADHFQFVRNTPTHENFNRGDVFNLGLNAWTDWAAGRTAFGAEMRQELIYSGNLGRDLDSTHWIPIGGKQADHRDAKGVWRDNDGSIAYYTKRAERTNVSYFVEHDLLFDHWTVSLGLMAQRNSSIDEQLRFYPGVDVAWRPNAAWRLTASWNRSLRLPTFTDLYYKNPSQEGNTQLRPEENSAFRLGATHRAACGITVEAAAFYNRGTNVLDWVMYDAQDKFHSTNFRLDNYGVNVTATADFARLLGNAQPLRSLRLDFARLWQDRKDNRPFFKSNYALEYLRHKFVATLDHRIFAQLGASWVLRVQDRNGHYMEVNRTNPAKLVETGTLLSYGTHATLDVKLHWTTDRYQLFCDLRNLTDSRYFDLGNVEQPGFFVMAGASYTF